MSEERGVAVSEPTDVLHCPLCRAAPGPGTKLARCACGGVAYQRDRRGAVQWFLSMGYARAVARRMVDEAVEQERAAAVADRAAAACLGSDEADSTWGPAVARGDSVDMPAGPEEDKAAG